VILQNYFWKLSFLKNTKSLLRSFITTKINEMLHIIFVFFDRAAVKTLAGVATCRGGGGERAGSSYELDAARSNQSN
jgi:hypothetical protein